MTIQNKLDSLQPYVIGIRFIDSMPVVDVVFKNEWLLPDSDLIKKIKGDETLNYYMLISERKEVGLDDLLEYVDITIKLNIEREKKHDLLKVKINELKEVFKKNSLEKLKTLNFTFGDDLTPSITDIDDSVESIPQEEEKEVKMGFISTSEAELTDEEKEILEEEKRAENFLKMKQTQKINNKTKVDLPSVKEEHQQINAYSDCSCGENEACDKCIDKKGY